MLIAEYFLLALLSAGGADPVLNGSCHPDWVTLSGNGAYAFSILQPEFDTNGGTASNSQLAITNLASKVTTYHPVPDDLSNRSHRLPFNEGRSEPSSGPRAMFRVSVDEFLEVNERGQATSIIGPLDRKDSNDHLNGETAIRMFSIPPNVATMRNLYAVVPNGEIQNGYTRINLRDGSQDSFDSIQYYESTLYSWSLDERGTIRALVLGRSDEPSLKDVLILTNNGAWEKVFTSNSERLKVILPDGFGEKAQWYWAYGDEFIEKSGDYIKNSLRRIAYPSGVIRDRLPTEFELVDFQLTPSQSELMWARYANFGSAKSRYYFDRASFAILFDELSLGSALSFEILNWSDDQHRLLFKWTGQDKISRIKVALLNYPKVVDSFDLCQVHTRGSSISSVSPP